MSDEKTAEVRSVCASPIPAVERPVIAPPPPIRVDREQLEAALEPVVSAMATLCSVLRIVSRKQVEALARIADAMEQAAEDAKRQRPPR